jgi:hypothetical protein
LRAIGRVGQAVNLAVERFVTVGETIADDNPDIKQDMYDACKEARAAGEENLLFFFVAVLSFIHRSVTDTALWRFAIWRVRCLIKIPRNFTAHSDRH